MLLLRVRDDDAVTILDFPDNVTVAVVSMAVGASGLVSTKTTVEDDRAAHARGGR
jgi:uncharacterized protein with GYD domain